MHTYKAYMRSNTFSEKMLSFVRPPGRERLLSPAFALGFCLLISSLNLPLGMRAE
jgi:hypothetical protein